MEHTWTASTIKSNHLKSIYRIHLFSVSGESTEATFGCKTSHEYDIRLFKAQLRHKNLPHLGLQVNLLHHPLWDPPLLITRQFVDHHLGRFFLDCFQLHLQYFFDVHSWLITSWDPFAPAIRNHPPHLPRRIVPFSHRYILLQHLQWLNEGFNVYIWYDSWIESRRCEWG